MMAELKKEKKEGNSQPSEKLRLEYKTNRLEERTIFSKAKSNRFGKQISDSQLSEYTFPPSCQINLEASKLACKLAIRTAKNDQVCKV